MGDTEYQRPTLQKLWDSWGLKPNEAAADQQSASIAALEKWLVDTKDPTAVLRAAQCLMADLSQPAIAKRPCFEAVFNVVDATWRTARTHDDRAKFIQASILCAWPVDEGAGLARLRPFIVGKLRHQHRAAQEILAWASRPTKADGTSKRKVKSLWTDRQTLGTALETLKAQGPNSQYFSQQATNLTSVLGQLVAAVDGLDQAGAAGHPLLDLLWWGQARYCRVTKKPYRRMSDDEKLWWAAYEIGGMIEPARLEPASAYLVETLHALGLDTRETKPLREWIEGLRRAMGERKFEGAPELVSAVRADALGLPVTFAMLAASDGRADDIVEACGLDPKLVIDRGDWADWVLRERLLSIEAGKVT